MSQLTNIEVQVALLRAHMHKKDLAKLLDMDGKTFRNRQMRNHKCLQKKEGWCKRFEPNIDHPWWQERFRRRSKEVGKPFIAKMKGGEDE